MTCSTAFGTTPHSRAWTSTIVLDPRSFTGRSARQVEDFVAEEIEPDPPTLPADRRAGPDSTVRV